MRGKSFAPVHLVSKALAHCPDFGAGVEIDTANVRQNANGEWTVPLTNLTKNGITRDMFDAVSAMCGDKGKLVVKDDQTYVVTNGVKSRSRSQTPPPTAARSRSSCLELFLIGVFQWLVGVTLWLIGFSACYAAVCSPRALQVFQPISGLCNVSTIAHQFVQNNTVF